MVPHRWGGNPLTGPTVYLGLLRLDGPPPACSLSPEEEARLRGIAAPPRADQYRAGRWLLRRLAGLAADVPESAVALTAAGPPRARLDGGMRAPFLSLAHSGPWVLGAASEGPCGVDVEALGARRDWAGLAAHLGVPGAPDEPGVLRAWTLREARYKALEPSRAAVWRLRGPGYLACLVAAPGARPRLHVFGGATAPPLEPEPLEPEPLP